MRRKRMMTTYAWAWNVDGRAWLDGLFSTRKEAGRRAKEAWPSCPPPIVLIKLVPVYPRKEARRGR